MAELTVPAWTARQTFAQWKAVAILRWKIFRNGLSRKGGTGDLVAKLLLFPLFAVLFSLPVAGAGAGAFYLAHAGQLNRLSWLLWGIFVLGQLVNINLGQPGSTFDPNQLIRFPLALRQFVLLRLFFGMLAPANVLVALMGCAAALGLSLALPQLWAAVTVALLVFIAVNVLFSRMVFAWVDRWLSTRRAREIFTGVLFLASLGFQYVNLSINTGDHRSRPRTANFQRWRAVGHAYEQARPALSLLPPELTAASVRDAQRGDRTGFTLKTAGSALFALLFLSIFALRMRTEFRGEALSDVAIGGAAGPRSRPGIFAVTALQPTATRAHSRWLRPAVRAVFAKELLYTRRNMGVFYSLLAPLAMVFIFSGRLATRNSTPWVLPAALAYTLIGVLPLSFNSFGLEGAGVQFYFFAPVRLRDVVLAKNLLGFGLAALEAAVTVLVIAVSVSRPDPLILVSCLLWAAATLLLGASLGNRRSLAAPRQIKMNKTSGKQASPLSALMSLGVLLLCALFGACTLVAARSFHLRWLALAVFAAMFALALTVYLRTLQSLDGYAQNHREELFAELSKS